VTLRWAKRSRDHFEAAQVERPLGERSAFSAQRSESAAEEGQTPNLFGIVQGGMFADLRRESAERLVEMDFPGYADWRPECRGAA